MPRRSDGPAAASSPSSVHLRAQRILVSVFKQYFALGLVCARPRALDGIGAVAEQVHVKLAERVAEGDRRNRNNQVGRGHVRVRVGDEVHV